VHSAHTVSPVTLFNARPLPKNAPKSLWRRRLGVALLWCLPTVRAFLGTSGKSAVVVGLLATPSCRRQMRLLPMFRRLFAAAPRMATKTEPAMMRTHPHPPPTPPPPPPPPPPPAAPERHALAGCCRPSAPTTAAARPASRRIWVRID